MWTEEIIEATIPQQGHEEPPSGYNMVGHIGRCSSAVYDLLNPEDRLSTLESPNTISTI